MARKPRVEYEGAVYHVMCRGDRQNDIFRDDKDRETFIDTMSKACDRQDSVDAKISQRNDDKSVLTPFLTPIGVRQHSEVGFQGGLKSGQILFWRRVVEKMFPKAAYVLQR